MEQPLQMVKNCAFAYVVIKDNGTPIGFIGTGIPLNSMECHPELVSGAKVSSRSFVNPRLAKSPFYEGIFRERGFLFLQ